MPYYYEMVVMMRSELTEEQNTTYIDKLAAMITEVSGQVSRREYWGVRALAYRIAKYRRAHYSLLNFEAPPAIVDELKGKFRLEEDVIRSLIIRTDKLETEPSEMMREPEVDEADSKQDKQPRRQRRGPTGWQPGQPADDIRSRLSDRPPMRRRDGDFRRDDRETRGRDGRGDSDSDANGDSRGGRTRPNGDDSGGRRHVHHGSSPVKDRDAGSGSTGDNGSKSDDSSQE